MQSLVALFGLLSPRVVAPTWNTPARSWSAAIAGLLASLLLSGIWGLAANSTLGGALTNAVTVPMLIGISCIAALPVTLLIWKLVAAEASVSALVLAYAAAALGGSLVLALTAPIVAIYQHTSSWIGPYVAQGAAVLALLAAVALLFRALRKLVPSAKLTSLIAPAAALAIVQIAMIAQLSSSVSPVMDHRTSFGRGIDGWTLNGSTAR